MLPALIHGKLSRDQENMEDLLTSNVFGILRYLPTADVILSFLSKASSLNGQCPLTSLSVQSKVNFEFWPWLTAPSCAGCEPDVLLRIDSPAGGSYLVLIEAKYRSGKSSKADLIDDSANFDTETSDEVKDQLAREWQQLNFLASKESRNPVLIYLTAHMSFPREEIQASERELFARGKTEATMCWLSWRHLATIVSKNRGSELLEDLLLMLQRLNLIFFQGFSPFRQFDWPKWHYSAEFQWDQMRGLEMFDWRFKV
jgi:hypothetical protein